MSVILVDSFEATKSGVTTLVKIFLDTDTGNITTEPAELEPSYDSFNPERTFLEPVGSYCVGLNEYYFSENPNAPYYGLAIELNSATCAVSPPQCDLNFSLVTTPESSPGVNDGKATINAASSFPPVLYSVNGITFQASNLFNNLAVGNHVAYAKDANGCNLSKPFTIEAYDNPIDGGFAGGLPVVVKSGNNISKWSAVYNPIVLNFTNEPDPAKKNFRVKVEITTQGGVVTGVWSPNTVGKTRCDISAYLRSLVNAEDDFNYLSLCWRDINRAASYTIRYRNVWDGGSSDWYYGPYPMYVVYAAKQLGDKYGGNMAEYVPFLMNPNPDLKARFMTGFAEPVSWVGLPFDVSFIYSDDLLGYDLKLRTISLDINKNPFGGASNAFILSNNSGYVLGTDQSRLIIQQSALDEEDNENISPSLGVNRLMLAGDPAQGVEYFKIQLYTGTDEAPNFVTQPLIIKANRQCNDPYIYLKWLNAVGGWDYWRFGHDQIVSLATDNDMVIDRNVFNLEADRTIADVIAKSAIKKIGIGAIISDQNVSGLEGLHSAIRVQMLTNTNPYKWQTIIVNSGSFEIRRTKSKYSELKFTISLPGKNIQRQ